MSEQQPPIYFDAFATTPMDPRVLDAMMPWFTTNFGNAASDAHSHGWVASEAVEHARAVIALAIGAEPEEIIFTSGSTESSNLALKGAAHAALAGRGNARRRILSVATEHKAVLDTLEVLAAEGFPVEFIPVDRSGRLDHAALRGMMGDDVLLASVMHANNETGVIHDIAAIGDLCAGHGVLLHTDATQSLGKIAFDVNHCGVQLASFSAHKLYGPKGIGALYVRRGGRPRARLIAQTHGGGHERGLRSGTLNVPAIVGFGRAIEIAKEEMEQDTARLTRLRDRLRDKLFGELDAIEENGTGPRLPHGLNVAFHYVDSVALLNALPGLAVSTGSACSSADPESSHVLLAMGLGEEHARSSVRFGLHRFTTEDEVDRAAAMVVAAVRELRTHSPLYEMREQ